MENGIGWDVVCVPIVVAGGIGRVSEAAGRGQGVCLADGWTTTTGVCPIH